MGYYNQLTFYFAMPTVGLAAIWLWCLLKRFLGHGDPEEALDTAWNNVQTFLFILYPTTASVVLNAFNCREILGKYYLAQDLASLCYTAEWRQYAILAVVGVAMYPL